jgi:hypothetical protein
VGPTCQIPRAAPGPHSSAPLPCGCHVPRHRPQLKATVGTARCASRQTRLTRAAVAARAAVPTAVVRSRVARTATPAASLLTVAVAPRHRLRAGEPPFPVVSRALAPCRRRLAEQHHHRAAPPPCSTVRRALCGPHRTVHLGRAWFRPKATQIKFYYFLIYSIHCKFKNLCRIHLNSENYEKKLLKVLNLIYIIKILQK